MNMIATLLFAGLALTLAAPSPFEKPKAGGENYAIVVAGSRTWGNYRHQADACHAVQILMAHGVPKKNIITMMYDDIANNEENPTKGVIINHPNGKDVYGGIDLDYKGSDVTPENFLKVLRGDSEGLLGVGTGRVLESGPNDNVFINFVDHGGPQIIAFPSSFLHASDLISALKDMHTGNKYSELTFYLEACESGSMFVNLLPTDINIYATTASSPTTSSYACYFDNKRRTYLGDVYSVNWMENTDASDVTSETLEQQFTIVHKETNTSAVTQYGTTSFTSNPIGDFLGNTKAPLAAPTAPITDAVDSRDVQKEILRKSIALSTSATEKASLQTKLNTLLQHESDVVETFTSIIHHAAGPKAVDQHMLHKVVSMEFDCVKTTMTAFHNQCMNISEDDAALKHSWALVSMCDAGISTEEILAAIGIVCPAIPDVQFS